MKLYDATSGTSLHEEPLRGFVQVLRARVDPTTGLFPSSVSGIPNADVPRGCASSWSALYLAQLDAGVAPARIFHDARSEAVKKALLRSVAR
jgi:hypothetical protein